MSSSSYQPSSAATSSIPSTPLHLQTQNLLDSFTPSQISTLHEDDYEVIAASSQSSEAAHEAITPTSDLHPPVFRDNNQGADSLSSSYQSLFQSSIGKDDSIDTSAITSPTRQSTDPSSQESQPSSPRPGATLKRTMSKVRGFFKRSNSQTGQPSPAAALREKQPPSKNNGTTALDIGQLAAALPDSSATPTARRKPSMSVSARTSPWHSPAATPGASNSSPNSTIEGDAVPKKLGASGRSNSGFFSRKPRITIEAPARIESTKASRAAAKASQDAAKLFDSKYLDVLDESVDQETVKIKPSLTQRDDIARPVATGAGLKARRLSINLPDEFQVDTVELDKEFVAPRGLFGKKLGTGATCNVKLVTRRGHSEEQYAVKEFRKRGSDEDAEEYDKKVKSEYTIAHSLHHPNIVESVRLCTHSDRWNVVMEYCAVGDLFSVLQQGQLDAKDKLCIWKQTVQGVAYLHSHGIAHRDIKLENLLMTNDSVIKITDFGVSEVFAGEHPGLRAAGGACGKNMGEIRRCSPGLCGSMPYMAPEVIAKKADYDPRPLDVWSLGILLVTMILGGNPWSTAVSSEDDAYARFESRYLKYTSASDPSAPFPPENWGLGPHVSHANLKNVGVRKLVVRMLHPIPEMRWTIQDVINNPYFKSIECCCEAPDEEEGRTGLKRSSTFDASKGLGSAGGGGMKVVKSHSHVPKKVSKIPQHRFDMGDGYR